MYSLKGEFCCFFTCSFFATTMQNLAYRYLGTLLTKSQNFAQVNEKMTKLWEKRERGRDREREGREREGGERESKCGSSYTHGVR